MLDALLKSKFYCRSKSEIKWTLKRIEMIKRKRNAMQKFLRNDVADLLKNNLQSNAYDRVEQMFTDHNLSWCYEFIEQSCLLILVQLSAMNKQRECPEECKEAIPTLMFAAARFADLPELRELRSLFSERYGNYLEPYVNQEFVKNLKANPPTNEIKLQMMEEIAMEYGIEWNFKILEQNLYNPPPFVQDWNGDGRKNESDKAQSQNSSVTKIQETEKKKTEVSMEYAFKSGLPYKSRAETEARKEEKHDRSRRSPYWSSNTSTCSETTTSPDDSASEDTPEGRTFYAAPYIKTESNEKSTISYDNLRTDMHLPEGRKQNGLRAMGPPYIKPDSSQKTAGTNCKDNDQKSEEKTENVRKPGPRSVRVRRPLKPASGSSRGYNDIQKARPSFPNGENHDPGYDHRDEEEQKMEKLLSHYGGKPSRLPATARTSSLPSEPVVTPVDERKGLARAVTYQPDSGSGPRGHVHPKLPDYDEFVARLAAFRASSS